MSHAISPEVLRLAIRAGVDGLNPQERKLYIRTKEALVTQKVKVRQDDIIAGVKLLVAGEGTTETLADLWNTSVATAYTIVRQAGARYLKPGVADGKIQHPDKKGGGWILDGPIQLDPSLEQEAQPMPHISLNGTEPTGSPLGEVHEPSLPALPASTATPDAVSTMLATARDANDRARQMIVSMTQELRARGQVIAARDQTIEEQERIIDELKQRIVAALTVPAQQELERSTAALEEAMLEAAAEGA